MITISDANATYKIPAANRHFTEMTTQNGGFHHLPFLGNGQKKFWKS